MDQVILSSVFLVIVALVGALWRTNSTSNNLLFKKVDSLKTNIQDVKDNLNKNYLDKGETEKLINLTNRPIFEKITHIETQIGEMKDMLEKVINKT